MRRRKTSRLLLIPPAHYTKSKTAPRQYGSGADLLASKGQSSAEAACSFEEKTLILQTTTGLDKARVTAAWLMLLKYNGHDECLANHIQSFGDDPGLVAETCLSKFFAGNRHAGDL